MGVAHRHARFDDGCTLLSDDVCLRPAYHGEGKDEHLLGFWICHAQQGTLLRCEGLIVVDEHFFGQRPIWQMRGTLEAGSLTLYPSVLCVRHNHHGHVRNGHWSRTT